MKFPKLAMVGAVVILSAGLQGCVIAVNGDGENYSTSDSVSKKEASNRAAIASFTDGMSVETVQNELGTPEFSDLWTVDNVRYRVLYYRTQRVHADGNTTRDECTPVVFANGNLIGTGEFALSRIPQNN
jgi:outer membrane protein assembly factor BamE (lipoprotein component of BamABCDE complex)